MLSGLVGFANAVISLIKKWACSSAVEQGTHNPLVPGSNPGGPRTFSIFDFRFLISAAQVRRATFLIEILAVTALVVVTRCANYSDVFPGNQINFVDADCFARMTRARICFEHPGTIVRRHDFENFPIGTSPHTTAPFDYLIVGTAEAL